MRERCFRRVRFSAALPDTSTFIQEPLVLSLSKDRFFFGPLWANAPSEERCFDKLSTSGFWDRKSGRNQRSHNAFEQRPTVAAAVRGFDRAFGVGHHAEHIARGVQYSGDPAR